MNVKCFEINNKICADKFGYSGRIDVTSDTVELHWTQLMLHQTQLMLHWTQLMLHQTQLMLHRTQLMLHRTQLMKHWTKFYYILAFHNDMQRSCSMNNDCTPRRSRVKTKENPKIQVFFHASQHG